MNLLSALKYTLRDQLLDPVPKTEKALNIHLGIGGDDASATLAKTPGGWLVDVAAFPETRPAIEQWVALAFEKAWLTKEDATESERWYHVADQLAAVCHVANGVYFARCAAAEGNEPKPFSESLMLQALRAKATAP